MDALAHMVHVHEAPPVDNFVPYCCPPCHSLGVGFDSSSLWRPVACQMLYLHRERDSLRLNASVGLQYDTW